ncbi:MAG: hypothetical protein WC587_02525 [Candidatus Paceibacterota bacterium]
MNQKGFALIAIILIIIGVLALGGGAWYVKEKKKTEEIKKQAEELSKNQNQQTSQQVVEKEEIILINKDNDIYKLNLLTGELTKQNFVTDSINTYGNILKFDGLSLKIRGEQNQGLFREVIFSQDGNEVLLSSILNGEFRCVLNLKKCFKSSIIADSHSIIKENNGCGGLSAWDSKKNFIFGYEGGGCQGTSSSTVHIIDLNKKIYKGIGKRIFFSGSSGFSPSLSKFFVIKENYIKKADYPLEFKETEINYQILVYDINNLLTPSKVFEFPVKEKYTYMPSSSGYVTTKYFSGPVSFRSGNGFWSPDEKFIVLSSGSQIYTLNFDTGKFKLVYNGSKTIYDMILSPMGRFIIFTDDFKNLKSVDLNNNLITEIKNSSIGDITRGIRIAFGLSSKTDREYKNKNICVQIITPAKNFTTGECREFPTPCDVPNDWEEVQSCSIGISSFDFSDWETYKNKQYNFEIKYPSKFGLKYNNINLDSDYHYAFDLGDDITIEIGLNENYLKVFNKLNSIGKKDVENIHNNNTDMILFHIFNEEGGVGGITALIKGNNYFYKIDGYSSMITNQILSTFKFIP